MSSSKIKKCLKEKNLGLAIIMLRKRIDAIGNYDLKNALEETEATYCTMLSYLLQGYEDHDIITRRNDILCDLFAINDKVDRHERIESGDLQSRYVYAFKQYDQKTTLYNTFQRLEVELAGSDHETEICTMFNYVWTSGLWSKGDYETGNLLLNSTLISDNDKAVFLSAVIMSLMETFDVRKVHLLLDAYLYSTNIINQRALVGIILIVRMYDSRLECYPEIQARLLLYSEDTRFIKELFAALIRLQYSCITDKVTAKVVNDIMPNFMFNRKNEYKSNEEIMSELTQNGENPEWLDRKNVDKSIREMAQLQTEGADVYMSSFRYMKGYTFFNKIPHWFYPYDKDNYLLSEKQELAGTTFDLIKSSSVFCDSDMYSFHFMFASLCDSDRDLVENSMHQQINEEEKDLLTDKIKNVKLTNEQVCRNFIFDLYRFYECYPFNNQFYNPFKKKKKDAEGKEIIAGFSPLDIKSFHFLLNNREKMLNIADFFMRKEFYEEALKMFDVIAPQKQEEDANIWQKIGFCKQRIGQEKSAYKMYLLADNLMPNSKWTMSHIVSLAMKLNHYDVALQYVEMLLNQDDENIKYIVNKAICLMNTGDYDNAIPTLFKANYLNEDSIDIVCMLIECYVKTGQLNKAEEKIESILTDEQCPIKMRILYALLSMNINTVERTYYTLREAQSYYNGNEPFEKVFWDVFNEYSTYIHIDAAMASMIHDSMYLDIR